MTASTQDALPVYVPGADQLDPGARGVLFTTAGDRLETEQADILAELAGDDFAQCLRCGRYDETVTLPIPSGWPGALCVDCHAKALEGDAR